MRYVTMYNRPCLYKQGDKVGWQLPLIQTLNGLCIILDAYDLKVNNETTSL